MGWFSLHLRVLPVLVPCRNAVTIGSARARCEARSAPYAPVVPRTPGPTTKPPTLRGPLYAPLAGRATHTRPHNNTPYIARPALRPTRRSCHAHQAPQQHPLHCGARPTPHPREPARTPDPTTKPPTLRGPLYTPRAGRATHTRPHNKHPPTLRGPLCAPLPGFSTHTRPHNPT